LGRKTMARISTLDRATMNAEQGRVYDEAKASNSPVGGPYTAYIRIPKLFEATQNMRRTMTAGPLSKREQQIVNITVARHWNARYPWHAQVRGSIQAGIDRSIIDAINTRKTPNFTDAREKACHAVAGEILANRGLSDASYTAAEKTMGLESLV